MTRPDRRVRSMSDHPLMADRVRLENITTVMYTQIQKIIYKRRPSGNTERVLRGGESADDILQKALVALLEYDPDKLDSSWEALSVGIAKNQALMALRSATKGRRTAATAPDVPDEVTLADVDLEDLAENNPDNDPEHAFESAQQQLILLSLARDQLDERERIVFFGIHHQGRTRAAIARDIGVTPQAVGQMYGKITKRLHAAACKDPMFPTDHGTPDGRTT